jgi:flavin-dependent dehydrogenase
MQTYDVAVVGGGIAGSVAARFAAEEGLRTLLIEKRKTPRVKSCSGIQFPYFEKLIGAEIPPDRLCRNELFKVEMVSPSGQTVRGRMRMLNFWRSTLDRWLNDIAEEAGATFHDETRLVDFGPDERGLTLRLRRGGQDVDIQARYLIAADGLYSRVRKSLRPQDFRAAPGGSLNYYCRLHPRGDTCSDPPLDPNTLYMVFNRDYAPLMFAWAYLKDDLWVLGTGADERPQPYADRFLEYMQERYGFQAEIVRREGFADLLSGGVYLGEGQVLVVGDAAGLIDMYRGVGMDNAALSARLAVKAIMTAEERGWPVQKACRRAMRRMLRTIRRNANRQSGLFASNEDLEAVMSPRALVKGAVLMPLANLANLVLTPERVIMLPL